MAQGSAPLDARDGKHLTQQQPFHYGAGWALAASFVPLVLVLIAALVFMEALGLI